MCPRRFKRGLDTLASFGFTVMTTRQSCQVTGFTAGSGMERAAALHQLIDGGAEVILTTIGGYNSSDMLPHIEYERVPKELVVIGYSDVTALLHALHHKSGIHALYGPMLLPQFGEYGGVLPFTAKSFRMVLERLGSGKPYPLPVSPEWTDEFHSWDQEDNCPRIRRPNQGWMTIRDGVCEGILWGGNMNTLVTMTGTPYLRSVEAPVLFLEEVDAEKPASVRRSLRHIASHFGDTVRGVILGRFQSTSGVSEEMIHHLLQDLFPGVPVLANVDFGHTDPMLTLPLGAPVTMDATEKQITVLL